MKAVEVQKEVIEIIADTSGHAGPITAESKLLDERSDGLWLDSLDIVEVVMGIEEQFQIEISDRESDKLFTEQATVGDVVKYVCERKEVPFEE